MQRVEKHLEIAFIRAIFNGARDANSHTDHTTHMLRAGCAHRELVGYSVRQYTHCLLAHCAYNVRGLKAKHCRGPGTYIPASCYSEHRSDLIHFLCACTCVCVCGDCANIGRFRVPFAAAGPTVLHAKHSDPVAAADIYEPQAPANGTESVLSLTEAPLLIYEMSAIHPS